MLCLDLDHFKNINDTLGHLFGDELLKSVAVRLVSCINETDMIARLGGDEFAIVQSTAQQPSAALMLAGRIHQAMKAPFMLDGLHAVTSASIGISLAPGDANTAIALMKQADMALYQAKGAGRDASRLFEPSMEANMNARRAIESDLRNAIAKQELELHYQPIINIEDNQIVALEALLRWRHPARGLLMPAEFIPVAEETGQIIAIGEWALRQACREVAHWPQHIKVAVNLSPAQVKDPDFLRLIVSALATSGLSPYRLELEITEKILLEDDDNTLALLRQLRELGVAIVLDDFGTGYSSLNYLRQFPLDRIKIDRSFIDDIAIGNEVALDIVRTVVQLARVLDVRTTAEGVETKEQLQFIRAAGCTEAQGYLFSVPKPLAELSSPFEKLAAKAASAA